MKRSSGFARCWDKNDWLQSYPRDPGYAMSNFKIERFKNGTRGLG
jgi:hypothetical protein